MRCIYAIVLLISMINAYGHQSKFKSLTDSAESYLHIDSEKALRYALDAKALALEMNDEEMEAQSKRIIGLAYYFHGYVEEAINYTNEAIEMFYLLKDSVKISSCYNTLGFIHKDMSNYEKAAYYYKKALEIDIGLDDIQGQAIVLNNLGELYHLQCRYNLAIYYYMMSLNQEIKINNVSGMADSYINIGVLMKDNDMYEEALYYYNKALPVFEQLDNKYRLGQLYNNIGIVLFKQGFYIKALTAFEKSIFYKKEVDDIQGKVTTYLNIGYVYILKRDTLNTKKFFAKAVLLDNKFFGHQNASDIEGAINAITELDDYFFYLISSDLAQGDYYELPERLYHRAWIQMLLGEYKNAIPFLLNSLEIAEFYDLKMLMLNNYKALYETYFNMGEFLNAAKYAGKYIEHSHKLEMLSFSDFHRLLLADEVFMQVPYFADKEENNLVQVSPVFYRSFWFYATIVMLILCGILVSRRFIEKFKVNNTRQSGNE